MIRAFRRRDGDLHHPRLSLPGRRRADDQFPPAALDAVHAGRAPSRARDACGRPTPTRSRRATASIPTATPACYSARRLMSRLSLQDLRAPTARRAPAHLRPPRGDDPHARLHAGRHRRRRSRPCTATRSRARRRHPARQHLSPDAAPGAERIATLGGLHRFMRWEQPILTDSGGFQVMSPGQDAQARRGGVVVPVAYRRLAPRADARSARWRSSDLLGSDIQMQFDECVACRARARRPSARCACRCAGRERSQGGLRRTQPGRARVRHPAGRRLRGSARRIAERAGRDRISTATPSAAWRSASPRRHVRDARDRRAASAGRPAALPDGRRHAGRYRRGRGAGRRHVRLRPADPGGRHGQAWTWDGPINLKNARFAEDRAARPDGAAPASRDYSRAYLPTWSRPGDPRPGCRCPGTTWPFSRP